MSNSILESPSHLQLTLLILRCRPADFRIFRIFAVYKSSRKLHCLHLGKLTVPCVIPPSFKKSKTAVLEPSLGPTRPYQYVASRLKWAFSYFLSKWTAGKPDYAWGLQSHGLKGSLGKVFWRLNNFSAAPDHSLDSPKCPETSELPVSLILLYLLHQI